MPNARELKGRLERALQTLSRCNDDLPQYMVDEMSDYLAAFEPFIAEWEFIAAQESRYVSVPRKHLK